MKDQLRRLMNRYINKITWLEDRLVDENHSYHKGMIAGLQTAINDLEDILNGIEV